MIDTERKKPFRVFKNIGARRIRSAAELANSKPVRALRDLLPQGLVTVTEPKGHPFSRIKAQALMRNLGGYTEATIEDITGLRTVSDRNFKVVRISFPRFRKKSHEFIVTSGNGKEPIPHGATPEQTAEIIRGAVANPLDVTDTFNPRSLKTQRRI